MIPSPGGLQSTHLPEEFTFSLTLALSQKERG